MRRVCLLGLLAALLLAGCGAQGGAQNTSTRVTATPGQGGQPTEGPSVASPTGEPVQAPTEQPAPPTATQAPAAQPSATALPTPQPDPRDEGTIYFLRDGDLAAYSIADKAERPITSGVPVEEFAASPDGRAVAVLHAGQLELFDASGQGSRPIAEGVLGGLAWAPDGSALAFVRGQGQTGYPSACTRTSEVLVAELASAQEPIVVGRGCDPAWSPEGKRLVYVGYTDIIQQPDNQLMLVNRQGQNGWTPLQGILADERFPEPRRSFFEPWWSEDGKAIFMLARFSEFAETSWHSIELVDATTAEAQPLGIALNVGDTVEPSPDRRRFAYVAGDAAGTSRLVVQTPLADEYEWTPPWAFEGEAQPVKLRDKIDQELMHAYSFAWAPDGRRLAVIYCTSAGNPMGFCEEGQPAELRLFDAASGELSEPLLDDLERDSPVGWGS